ncbi:MAG: hypothetical protein IKM20_07460 [Erysipelotrichales bacterium]|nr:hypothetical protein [Erysipelotrichales bacterium]
MKKQGILLLTFMSVIMMMSIYYITLPLEEVSNETDKQFNEILLEKENSNNDYINKESKVVSSVSSTVDEKQVALSNIESKKQLMQLEKELEEKLLDNSIEAVCSIKNETVYITVNEQKDKQRVLEILEIIKPEISSSYLYEVSFVLK